MFSCFHSTSEFAVQPHDGDVWLAEGLLHTNALFANYDGLCARTGNFVSHAWFMPFKKLVQIVVSNLSARYSGMYVTPTGHDIGHACFLWIDVFCKNQHRPAPAMQEFENAMRESSRVIFCLWPVPPVASPISLTRIWCLFEAWTCLKLGVSLLMSIEAGSNYEKCQQGLHVDVSKAKATQQGDIDIILGLIRDHIGIDQFNEALLKGISEGIRVQMASSTNFPSCFDGQGRVLMADGSLKAVQEVRAGDVVRTCDAQTGLPTLTTEVVLVAMDDVGSGEVEMCEYKGLLLTPEHPVLVSAGQEGQVQYHWRLPKDFLPVQKVSLNRVYNFELQQGHTVQINGVVVLTLGNDLTLGLHAENEEQYGRGWHDNPKRRKYLENMLSY